MTIDLDALRALLDKATPGPWTAKEYRAFGKPTGDTLLVSKRGDHVADVYGSVGHRDAALIAAAVNALPALLARVRELERENDRLSEELWRIR